MDEFVNNDGSNRHTIICAIPGCKSVILRPGHAKYKTHEEATLNVKEQTRQRLQLPTLINTKTNEHSELATAKSGYWSVKSVFTFDNIGFSKTAAEEGLEGIRYLCCADCDSGPLGLEDTKAENPDILLAADRVAYRQ